MLRIKALLVVLIASIVVTGCTHPVSISLRKMASEFVVGYIISKEVLDPLLYPDKSKEEIRKLKNELGKVLFNQIWADFGFTCGKDEDVRECHKRVKHELKVWLDYYTDEFVKNYEICKDEALAITYERYDLLKTFKDIDDCLLKKNKDYQILIEESKKTRKKF